MKKLLNDAMIQAPLKLVILIQDLEFGGTQRYVINLLNHLDRSLICPELWVLRGGLDMLPMLEAADVRIRWLSRTSFVSPLALVNLMIRLIQSRIQILYTLTVVPNIWGRIFGKIARVPVIVSGYRSLFPGQYEKWLWPASRRIICNAEILKDIMIHRFSVAPGRIAVIPNAVDTDLYYPMPDQKTPQPTVLFIGRLVKEKAPLDLLKAFSELHSKIPEACLEIIGNGPLRNQLEDFIADHSLQPHVNITTGVVDTRPYLNRAWVFSLPSIKEASPNVILEAMAESLPVVATRVGGIPELVMDGGTGVLVEPNNPHALASALAELLLDKPRMAAMGQKARERVMANHTMNQMARQTEKALVEAANEFQEQI